MIAPCPVAPETRSAGTERVASERRAYCISFGAGTGGLPFGAIGITKLAGYCRCLSVIESVMPKSMNTALAIIFGSMVLGIDPEDSLPSSVLHCHFKGSSDRRTMTVTGIGVGHRPRLFSNTHCPALPSLNEMATGVIGSFVKVAQPTTATLVSAIRRRFIEEPPSPYGVLTLTKT